MLQRQRLLVVVAAAAVLLCRPQVVTGGGTGDVNAFLRSAVREGALAAALDDTASDGGGGGDDVACFWSPIANMVFEQAGQGSSYPFDTTFDSLDTAKAACVSAAPSCRAVSMASSNPSSDGAPGSSKFVLSADRAGTPVQLGQSWVRECEKKVILHEPASPDQLLGRAGSGVPSTSEFFHIKVRKAFARTRFPVLPC